jgi:putative tryptophan/tyrosine transport system substrate-binding protein
VKRREFITLLASAAAAWPLAARAQQAAKVPTIGFFSAGSAAALEHWIAAFVQRLRELGWSEGSTVAIEYLWADGQPPLTMLLSRHTRRRELIVRFC